MAKMLRSLLLTTGILFSSSQIMANTKVVIAADENYAPYSYKKGSEVHGIYTEILKEAFKMVPGYTVEIKAMPWKRGLSQVEKGEVLGIYPPYFRAADRPYLQPYSMPILDEGYTLVCADEAHEKFKSAKKWPNDFKGLKLGINRGFSVGGLDEGKKAKLISVTEVNDNEANLKKLQKGRIDCLINDYLSILHSTKELQAAGKVDKNLKLNATFKISNEKGFIGYAKKADKFPFKDDFVWKVDQAIYKLHRSGRIKEILDRYTSI